ncbi:MAG: serine hydrolase [Eubacteriales bacterium]|nr:serine hydrolase [Eubacteriales bacterium]
MTRKHSRNSRLRQLRLIRLTALCVAAVLVLVLLITNAAAARGSRLDVSIPYQLSYAGSTGAVKGTAGFADKLVTCEADVGTDQIMLKQATERGLLFNLNDQKALYGKDIYKKIYPASITKLMTALICMESADLTQEVTMRESDFDLDLYAQKSELEAGDKITMEVLLKLLVVYSANDAAMAIARTIGGDVKNFVEMMNTRAKELGMTGTHFCNPHGLHEDDHYTTVYDIYLMLNACYQYPIFTEFAALDILQVNVSGTQGETYFIEKSTDEYITGEYSLPQGIQILASKTGTTDEAGSCLSLVVQNEYGVPYIAILTGAYNKDDLYGDMSLILNLINADK